MRFWDRLIQAAEDGAVLGVKYAVVIGLVLAALWIVFSDYAVVRQRALNGQVAFETLRMQQQQESSP